MYGEVYVSRKKLMASEESKPTLRNFDSSCAAHVTSPLVKVQDDSYSSYLSEERLVDVVVTSSGAEVQNSPPSSNESPLSLHEERPLPAVTSSDVDHQLPKLVKIRGFMVLRDHVPIVEAIYEKYGDISSECKFSTPYIKTALMESVIRIVQIFQQNTTSSLSETDATYIHDGLHDLELAKFDVEWLKEIYNIATLQDELAEDAKAHDRLCKMISKTETVLEKLKADRKYVSTEMNKKRRILVESDVEGKYLGENLL